MAQAVNAAPAGPCTVVIPVFNAFAATRRCLESLARHTAAAHPVIVVDDASSDPRIPALLRDFARRPGVVVLENAENSGFTASANRGIEDAAGDVVVLNSDTVVTAGWLEGLARCRASDPAIGIACPLSNNATLLSLEGVAELFRRPDGTHDVDALGACVRAAGPRTYVRIPTAVGFCMLLTRELLDRAGRFDPLFGRGYGEENDLSMRALDLGFEIACCDDVYVHHEGEASFSAVAGIESAREANRAWLERRWPAYAPGVAAWWRANALRPVIERITAAAERERLPGRPRVLLVTHRIEGIGGIEEHTRVLLDQLKDDVAYTVVTPLPPSGAWPDMVIERPRPGLRIVRVNFELASVEVRVLGAQSDISDERVERAFGHLLAGGFDVVHFQSLLGWNTLRLPVLAREAGARVVVSVHDKSWMCADFNMVAGPRAEPCGRVAARASDPACAACIASKSSALAQRAPAQVGAWIESRHAAAASAMSAADAIVSPSRFASEAVRRAFGAAAPVRVIGHGVADHPTVPQPAARPMLRVAYLGRFSVRKGAHLLVAAAQRVAGERIVFEAWGPVEDGLDAHARAAGVLLRGAYEHGDLPGMLREIDLVVVPTMLEESFCLVVSEAQQLGVPVAASAVGAIPERICDGDTGFLFKPGSVDELAALLLRLRDNREPLDRVAANLRRQAPRTHRESAQEYLSLYKELRPATAPVHPQPVSTEAVVVRGSMGMPRARHHTRLGAEAYDHWLADAPASAPGTSPPSLRVVELPRASDAEDLRALNRRIDDAGAEWVVLQQSGDHLAAGALETLARACASHPRACLLYADHDAASIDGQRYDPVFKPRFSPELLRHAPYIAGLCALHRPRLVASGGLRAPGWFGVVEYALRLAESNDPNAVVALPELLVHRHDVNIRAQDADAARLRDLVAAHLRRIGSVARYVEASAGVPGMWVHRAPSTDPVTVLVRASASPQHAAACIDQVMATARSRIATLCMDQPAAQWGEAGNRIAAHGVHEARAVASGGAGIEAAISRARTEWIAIVDPRCTTLVNGWLDWLEEGVNGPFAGAIGCDTVQQDGRRVAGWEAVGAGPEGIAGLAPSLPGPGASSALYALPREVSVLSDRLVLVRKQGAIASGALPELGRAGHFALAHLCLALDSAGYDCLTRPVVAAAFAAGDTSTTGGAHGADWMRARWGARLAADPYFPALAARGYS